MKTFLGRNTDGASVTKDEANQLVSLPLKITDVKNIVYSMSSYHFLYKRKSVFQDEETGKKQTSFTTVSDLFTVTPLPKVWQANIANGVQSGEEFYFFDILVIDKLGRKFFAPDLKIKVL
ncbi:MAG: hypothetical protein H0W12_05705 [Chitinophagaceae bacterium]|nr:hypothetical protein [Chitinophagaceae bacterium]